MSGEPILFDFTGNASNATSMSFLQSGVSLTVSSALYNGGTGGNQLVYEYSTPSLSMTSSGIGALNTYGDLGSGFDSDGKYEMATLSFGQAVKITSVTLVPTGTRFNTSGANTKFLFFDQGLVSNPSTLQTIDPTDYTNEVAIYGSYLGIAAFSRFDGFRLSSITVEALDLQSFADAYALNSEDTSRVLDVLANDIDDRRITSIDTTGVLGSVSLAADGLTLSYSSNGAFDFLAMGETATETFTYTVLGWDGSSETQTVTVTVTGGGNTINGTSVAETINGTENRDVIFGFGGRDTISGQGGNDTIDGGNDNDLLHGNAGHDNIVGGSGNDTVYGDDGNDTLAGGDGNDVLYGGDGNDSIDGSIGTDRLYGGAGDDRLTGGTSANTLDGGTGADTMQGGGGNDSYYVDDSNDVIIENTSSGTDTVYATASYTLADQVENLVIQGTANTDGSGNSLVNRLTGNAMNNALFGYSGNDRLDGAAGNDDLTGGLGRDILTGGLGEDTFRFAEWGSANYDTVNGFNGVDDSIGLLGSAFGLGLGALSSDAFVLGTAATNADQHLIYDQASGNLYFDADGNGSGARQQVASLGAGVAVTFQDFFVF